MKRLANYFLRGLVVIAPVAITFVSVLERVAVYFPPFYNFAGNLLGA